MSTVDTPERKGNDTTKNEGVSVRYCFDFKKRPNNVVKSDSLVADFKSAAIAYLAMTA